MSVAADSDPEQTAETQHQHQHQHQPDQQSPCQSSDISEVQLFGVPLASLRLHREERLCLAQISATLLSRHTYNEIHNRRVALGITCVQCTPSQLDCLRRVGAMPAAAKRCGTITVREAERLVRSFQGESARPLLPPGYSFEVDHACGWGCRGKFYPDRYTSSRARCVMCSHCQQYFSPNKFIFHSHSSSEGSGGGVFRQPDAANFNAWRRHLVLTDPAPSSEVLHSWEDIKALYNGGSRMSGGGGGGCASSEKPCQSDSSLRQHRADSNDSGSSYNEDSGGGADVSGDGSSGACSAADCKADDSGCAEAEKLSTATWPMLWAKCLLMSSCNLWDGGQLCPALPAPLPYWGIPQQLQQFQQPLQALLPQASNPLEVASAAATVAPANSSCDGGNGGGGGGGGGGGDGGGLGCRGVKRRRDDYSIAAIMNSKH